MNTVESNRVVSHSRAAYDTSKLAGSTPLRWLYKICAVLCIVLGIIGVFLPLMPTTVFLLLAVFFSIRSSPSIYRWLVEHPRLGPPLVRYLEDRSISPQVYWRAVSIMWVSMLLAIWMVKPLLLKGGLLLIAASVTTHMTKLMRRGK